MGRIVVGVDGSSESHAALAWAVEEGRLRGAEVEAVHVWSYPAMTYLTGLVPPPTFAHDDLAEEARAVLDRACDVVEATTPAPSTAARSSGAPPPSSGDGPGGRAPVRRLLAEGSPAAVLLGRAEGADLLVLGSRGRGGFSGLLLGSVSQQSASHAPCPVVIVR